MKRMITYMSLDTTRAARSLPRRRRGSRLARAPRVLGSGLLGLRHRHLVCVLGCVWDIGLLRLGGGGCRENLTRLVGGGGGGVVVGTAIVFDLGALDYVRPGMLCLNGPRKLCLSCSREVTMVETRVHDPVVTRRRPSHLTRRLNGFILRLDEGLSWLRLCLVLVTMLVV